MVLGSYNVNINNCTMMFMTVLAIVPWEFHLSMFTLATKTSEIFIL